MWRLYESYYDRCDEPRFRADLADKDDVILVRDAADGSLQGFTTLCSYPHEVGGRTHRVVFSGDTIIAAPYQGQSALQRAFVRYVMGVAWRHRRDPVHWFLISKGYKTYLLMSRNFVEYWPRWDRETPPAARELVSSLARRRFGASFREDLGVVRFDPPGPRLMADVAPIEPAALARPDVAFFVARNPGWADGDELCCVGRVEPAMAANYLRRLGARLARRALARLTPGAAR